MTTTPSSTSSETAQIPVRRLSAFVLVGWTLFLWASRLRLVLDNDDLDTWGTTWRVGVVVIFSVLGLIGGYGLLRRSHWATPVMAVLVWWTIAFWLVRGTGIIIDDHDLGFTVIHTILMIVSIGTALWASANGWAGRAMWVRAGRAR